MSMCVPCKSAADAGKAEHACEYPTSCTCQHKAPGSHR